MAILDAVTGVETRKFIDRHSYRLSIKVLSCASQKIPRARWRGCLVSSDIISIAVFVFFFQFCITSVL